MTCSLCPRFGLWTGALLLSLSLVVRAMAAESGVFPSVELRQEYTDNLFYSSSGPLETFFTRVSPGIKAIVKTELLSGSLAARLGVLHYSANSNMDEVEQFYEGDGTCRLTPQLKFSGSAAYRKESSPDRNIESSGQALNTTSRRQNYGAGSEYQLSALTVGSLGYGYEQIVNSNHTNYSDVTTHNVSAGLEHDAGRLLPLLRLRTSARYSRNDYDTTQIESYELTAGGSRQLHELWSISADAGGRYTRSGFQSQTLDPLGEIGTRHDTNDTAGWVLKTSLDYLGETLKGKLAYSRDLSNPSGLFGTAVEQDIVTISLRKRLSYELFALLGGGYYHSMSDMNQFGSQKIDETSLRGSFSLRYEFNHTIAAELGYDYFHVKDTDPGSTASRNKVFFQLTAQTGIFE